MSLVLMGFGTWLRYECACKFVFVLKVLKAELAAAPAIQLAWHLLLKKIL